MNKFTKGILAAALICAASYTFYACNQDVRSISVNPPFQEVKIAYNQYTIDPVKGGEIALENGTKITIPANAFKNANGKIITEPVSLKYREFHTPAQILASGIPMVYDSAGTRGNFESAGMFDINAFTQNNEPVFVADGKNLTVQMASFKAGNDYNFYKFSEEESNWNYITTKPAEINKEKQAVEDACAKLPDAPCEPQKPAKDALVFDLDVNYALYPELEGFDGVMWQFAGTDPKTDPKNNDWLFKEKWQYVQLNPANRNEGTFKLQLTAGGRAFETLVKPVLRGNSYKVAMAKFDKKAKEYEEKTASILKEKERVSSQANLMRTFQVSNFGIYNCDRLYNQPNVVSVKANVEFDQDVDMKNTTLYLVCGEERTVICYYPQYGLNNFSFEPNKRNVLLAVMPGDHIAVYSPDDFANLDINQLKQEKNHTFYLKTLNRKIKDINDLDEVLRTI